MHGDCITPTNTHTQKQRERERERERDGAAARIGAIHTQKPTAPSDLLHVYTVPPARALMCRY